MTMLMHQHRDASPSFYATQQNARLHRAPRFSNAGAIASPILGAGGQVFNSPGLLRTFDFKTLGQAAIPQNQLIYMMVIASRAAVGMQRSRNEVREVLVRDLVGWSFWFYATPMVLRGYLALASANNPILKAALLQEKPKPNPQQFQGLRKGFEQLKALTWHINPLQRFNMPSPDQLKAVKNIELHRLEASSTAALGDEGLRAARKALHEFYDSAVMHRNIATAVGLILTIGLLGFGIPLLNIWMTRQNVEQKKEQSGDSAMPQSVVATTSAPEPHPPVTTVVPLANPASGQSFYNNVYQNPSYSSAFNTAPLMSPPVLIPAQSK